MFKVLWDACRQERCRHIVVGRSSYQLVVRGRRPVVTFNGTNQSMVQFRLCYVKRIWLWALAVRATAQTDRSAQTCATPAGQCGRPHRLIARRRPVPPRPAILECRVCDHATPWRRTISANLHREGGCPFVDERLARRRARCAARVLIAKPGG